MEKGGTTSAVAFAENRPRVSFRPSGAIPFARVRMREERGESVAATALEGKKGSISWKGGGWRGELRDRENRKRREERKGERIQKGREEEGEREKRK